MPRHELIGIDTGDPIYPFRWDVSKRSQLGRLTAGLEPDRDSWLQKELSELNARQRRTIRPDAFTWFERELLRACARIIAFCDNSDLCFVGRSPESIFDYLSGLLLDTSWAERLMLFNFSMRWVELGLVRRAYPRAIPELRVYLAHQELDPDRLARRERPVALVDIVATGRTLGNLIRLLQNWCAEIGGDWGAVRRKLRIVALTERMRDGPDTWRWQQHAPWLTALEPGIVKNAAIPPALFNYLGAAQAKVTRTFPPAAWADPQVTRPDYEQTKLMALRMAVSLFDAGRERTNRLRFVTELSRQPAMPQPWFRALIQELSR